MTRTRLSSKLQRLKRLIRLGMPCAVASRKIKRVFSDSRANLESLLKKAYASSKTSPNFHDKFLVRLLNAKVSVNGACGESATSSLSWIWSATSFPSRRCSKAKGHACWACVKARSEE